VNPRDPNVRLVEGVVQHLGELKEQFVFVGGCATGLLITDLARPPVRATTDVDLVTEVATRSDYYELAEQLRRLGFTEDAESDVICRWRIGVFQVDVMPTNQEILGFENRWHRIAVETSTPCLLPSGATIMLISAPLFLATKLEAFHDRGDQDYGVSHDIEDILTVIDGRQEIVEEVAGVATETREYICEEFESLLSERSFTDSISWHLTGDKANQDRVPMIIGRLREIAGV
jgi:predicted nucleotidyltransferase